MAELLDDARHGRLRKRYQGVGRPSLGGLRPERSIFAGKRYLPIGLVKAGRGCHFHCDFCAVQTVFAQQQTLRPIDDVLDEIRRIKDRHKLLFFVGDNITSNLRQAKAFFEALAPLNVRRVSQASINAAHDEEFLELLVRSGCQGVLIGFERLDPREHRTRATVEASSPSATRLRPTALEGPRDRAATRRVDRRILDPRRAS